MASGKNQTHFVLFRKLATELDAVANFEFGVAVVSESKCRRSIPETKVGVEQEWIFVKDFSLVAALRDFRRKRNRPAVAEHVPSPVLRADDSDFKRPVTDRHAELFALRFLGRNVQEKLIFIRDRRRFDLEHVEQPGAH